MSTSEMSVQQIEYNSLDIFTKTVEGDTGKKRLSMKQDYEIKTTDTVFYIV